MAARKINSRLAESLGMPDDERAILWPREWLQSDDKYTRKRAEMLLQVFTGKDPIGVLDRAQEDEDLNLTARLALVWLGKRGLRSISRMLAHSNPRLRSNAIDSLVYYRTHHWQRRVSYTRMRENLREFVPGIIEVMQHDPDSQLRLEAAKALGEIGDVQAVEALRAAQADPVLEVRLEAIRALGGIADYHVVEPLFALLSDPEPKVRSTAVSALARLADLRSALLWPSEAKTGQPRALGEMVAAGAVEPLIGMLSDADVHVQETVIDALAAIHDERAIGPLSEMLHGSEGLHDQIVHALGDLGALQATEPLMAILADKSKDELERASAVDDLVNVDGKELRTFLMDMVHSGDEEGRWAIVQAVQYGKLYDKALVDLLVSMARNAYGSKELRRDAIEAIGGMSRRGYRSKEATELLISLLSDNEFRSEAAFALGYTRDKSAVEPLISLLKSTYDESVKWCAANALGRLGDSRAVEPLLEMLKDKEIDQRVCAIYSLSQIGDQRALPALEEISKHDIGITAAGYEARYDAARAIRNIKRRRRANR